MALTTSRIAMILPHIIEIGSNRFMFSLHELVIIVSLPAPITKDAIVVR